MHVYNIMYIVHVHIFVQCELDHDNEVSCIDLNSDALKVASGTVDGMKCLSMSNTMSMHSHVYC